MYNVQMPHQVNTRSPQMTNIVWARFKPTTFMVLGSTFLSGILHHPGCFIVAGAFRDLSHLPVTMPRFETLASNEAHRPMAWISATLNQTTRRTFTFC